MATKPEKTEWTPGAGDRETPSGAKKNTGWLADERPPYQFFNWFWYVLSLWQNWLAPAVRHNVIISDNADERDFATLASYIAGAPAAGDRVLITNNQVIAAQLIIPNNITLCIQDGVKFTSAIDLSDSLLEFGSNVVIEGVLVLELSHAGTTDAGIELNGDGNNLDIVIDNTSTGTLAIGVLVNVATISNLLKGEVKNTGAGAITTVLNDLSLDESNIVEIRDSINNIVERSLGALSFLTGFTMDLGSDADGDVYYRDAGILKRLAKGADGQLLELASGIPSWVDKFNAGKLVQQVNVQDGEVATGTTVMIDDDTIPQNTEGDEYITLSITPINAANKLKIDVEFNGTHTQNTPFVIALFQDAIANALKGVFHFMSSANDMQVISFSHWMTAGTVSSITFKVRAGSKSAGTTTFNGEGGARRLGGVALSSITITEIQV